jgi:hypothetical protein
VGAEVLSFGFWGVIFMRRRYLLAALPLIGLTVPVVAGCSAQPLAVCGVVVDSTSYAESAESRSDIDSDLPTFANGCDWIAFAAVTGRSETTVCRERPVPIAATSQENPNRNPKVEEKIRAKRITEVLPKAQNLLKCPTEGKGSDVLGALRYIARQMEAQRLGDRKHEIIVFSDLVNNQGALNLTKDDLTAETSRTAKIKQLESGRLLPSLTGYGVVVHGFLRKEKANPDRLPNLDRFWQEAFQTAGAGSVDLL